MPDIILIFYQRFSSVTTTLYLFPNCKEGGQLDAGAVLVGAASGRRPIPKYSLGKVGWL
jgi:hypothetical protein